MMKIRVMRRHIKTGKPETGNQCPIALAIREYIGSDYVDVAKDTIIIGKAKFKTPTRTVRFIIRFDSLKQCKPFSFILK